MRSLASVEVCPLRAVAGFQNPTLLRRGRPAKAKHAPRVGAAVLCGRSRARTSARRATHGFEPRRWTAFERSRDDPACLGGAVWEKLILARSSARSPVGARGHHGRPAAHPARSPRDARKLRSVVRDCLEKHLDDSAVFFADKLVSMSGDGDARDPDDLFLYCQALFAGKHHRRALTVMRGEGLVDGGDVPARDVPRCGRTPRGSGCWPRGAWRRRASGKNASRRWATATRAPRAPRRTRRVFLQRRRRTNQENLQRVRHRAAPRAGARSAGESSAGATLVHRRVGGGSVLLRRAGSARRQPRALRRGGARADRLARVRPGGRVAAVPVHVHGQKVRRARDRERAGDAGGNRGFHQRRG